jgi:hypothetical protein
VQFGTRKIQMPKLLIFFFALAILSVTTFVWASESDEIREKAKAMQREAAELAEKGHKEEAATGHGIRPSDCLMISTSPRHSQTTMSPSASNAHHA